jgi:uncharacterized RDD family membrane protein YckC
VQLDDRITIRMPEGLELEVQLAGLGSRFIAGMADFIIQLTLVIALILITGAVSGGGSADLTAGVIGIFLVWFVYPIAFEVLARGRTPGKRFTHLRVVMDDGSPVSLGPSATRNFMRLIDGMTLFYVPTVVSILATRLNQRPGDLAAGTLVIREEPGIREQELWTSAPAFPLTVSPTVVSTSGWDISAVTDADLATARQFLARRNSLDRLARAELARRLSDGLGAKVAGVPAGVSGERFLEALVEIKLNSQWTD